MNAKKVLLLVVVAIMLFFMITEPTQAASLVQGILGGLRDAAKAVITFLQSL